MPDESDTCYIHFSDALTVTVTGNTINAKELCHTFKNNIWQNTYPNVTWMRFICTAKVKLDYQIPKKKVTLKYIQHCWNRRLGLEPYFKAVSVCFKRRWVSSGGWKGGGALSTSQMWRWDSTAGFSKSLGQLAFSTSSNFSFLFFHSSQLSFSVVPDC